MIEYNTVLCCINSFLNECTVVMYLPDFNKHIFQVCFYCSVGFPYTFDTIGYELYIEGMKTAQH